jgi:hypothetical protein
MLGHGALGELALGETESAGDTIYPSSISSAEAFGSPTVTADIYVIFPAAIASAEAFGSPVVQENTGTITGAGDIASAQAFGTPSVVLVTSPSSIASAEAFGVPFMGVEVTYEKVSRATMAARRILNLGGMMGNKFASYYYNGGTDTVNNSTDADLSLDTESMDENNLATLSGNVVTINTTGRYLVYAAISVSAGAAFNGYIGVYLDQTDTFKRGYATAMGLQSDVLFIGPTLLYNSSTLTLTPQVSNYSGQTISAYVYELTLIKLE